MNTDMMHWTGNPYVDIGLATILAFCDRDDPAQLTADELEGIAAWIAENYLQNPLKSFLTVAFPNSAFTNPTTKDEKRKAQVQAILLAHKEPASESAEICILSGDKVIPYPLIEDGPSGRAYKQHIPLIMGEGQINFYSYGNSGLPISGWALLCVQMFPMGCAKVAGKLLAVHASDPAMTLALVQQFLRGNLSRLKLAQQAQSKEMPATPFTLGTAVVSALNEIFETHKVWQNEGVGMPSLTAYHLTNFGQSPEIAIYHLPLGVTRFLQRAMGGSYRNQWQRLAQSAWQREAPQAAKGKGKRANKSLETVEPAPAKTDRPRRNYLYEDLLRLPENAAQVLRTYFLRKAAGQARFSDQDPRARYSTRKELALISWELTRLFLLEVMNMDQTRIEHIRRLGDGLADYVRAENDRKFFRAFFGEMSYPLFRNRLIKADSDWVRRGNPPLITFEQYIEVFEEGDEIARKDWRLARDLVLIRMIEQLHANGWLAQNQDALPDATEESDEGAEAQLESVELKEG